ncbi:periplasmic serine protease, Do/DeqQ family [Thioflavicoccus mobilis 8321]|uniref:Probable periplasmic serine endoprotease DegP-like n=1 Tax=Thioflavicoccus mobilis 8321 TaxID=765912 RepID=L0GZ59_9GAMM|nr:DegQ family serine endoprotease [Thioflavicoccus mobilis]AGA90594.1 periplasmic serine protease, Do/DeqQ family [Thioflavicoccus mobilis 8321]
MNQVSRPIAILIGLVFCLLLPLGAVARDLPDFTTLFEQQGPAVVNISTQQEHGSAPAMRFSVPDLPEDSPFHDFFRRFFGDEGEMPNEEIPSRSLGSGFIISHDGDVLTNAHVVEGASEIIVRTADRREFVATIVGSDKRSDIALLKIDGKDLPVTKLGSANDLKVGEWVLAIGSPFGFEHSMTAGIVSAKGRNLPSENYVPFIQTDVAINPGNSGGPLFNLDGEVVGVNSQIYSRTGGFMGLSFAIPIDVAMDVVHQLKTKGRVTRGWLGVLIQDVTRDLAETFGMPQPMGALVAQVLPDGPAAKAGLEAGDIILSFDGKKVATSSALPPLVGTSPVDQPAEVEILRDGKTMKIDVVIGELPDDDVLASSGGSPEPETTINRIGLVISDLTADQRAELGIVVGGVQVDSVANGTAEQAGIRDGDVILAVNHQPVENVTQFNNLLDELEPGRSVALLVQRGGGRLYYPVRIPDGKS